MTSTRLGSLLASLLVLVTALAGCHGLDDGEDPDSTPSPTTSPSGTVSPTPTVSPTTSPPPTGTPDAGPEITLTIDGAPFNVTVGDTIVVNITVDGDEIEASVADLYFAYASTTPIDPENLTTDDFNGTIEGNGNVSFPGRYSTVNWTIDDNRSLFIRAHILFGGDHYWSAEATIAVNEEDASPPIGRIYQVRIDTLPEQAPCQLANFQGENGGALNPTRTTIKIGEAVVFINQETAANCVHTATSTADPPVFDTGPIPQGATTEPIQFLQAGTYAFVCDVHPDTMKGEIVVTAV